MAGAAPVPRRGADGHRVTGPGRVVDARLLREVAPGVIGILVRRGADFATAEDAVQEALVQAALTWPQRPPDDPKGWLVTVAWRKLVDARRSEAARRDREDRVAVEPPPGPAAAADDTLALFFLCAHPSLPPASAVALTLRAVGGLTTKQIAQAYLVPEATMAQRISRAKRTVRDVRFDAPGDLATVLRVLYLVFNEGYTGDVDLAAEAVRLVRQVAARTDDEETAGLLALVLLHHARRPARTRADGSLVPLAEQDRSLWDTALITEGVAVLQAALVHDRLGEFQAQAAIAALHADAPRAEETDWPQIVGWYDELLRITGNPVVRLNRAVAVGEADGPTAGLAALAEVDPALPRHTAASAYLHERAGDLPAAARLYAEAARGATTLAERHHLAKQAARIGQELMRLRHP
ncbi:RNA polymerase subunit sigma-24 [Pseudonocardia sp. KRD-182]|nr:RNA polymerase subunit sigma-24 [Pseudonocardia oceani]